MASEEKSKALELKERAEQIAAQAGQITEEAVKEYKEEIEKTKKSSKSKEKLDTLVSADQYLAAGIHIGQTRKINDMKKFIFKVRADGLGILDVGTIDKRIRTASAFLSKIAPEKVTIVCGRDIGKKPVQKFCELTGFRQITTRFMPGSLTNPSSDNYIEPELIMVIDPATDRQAIMESLRMNIPIIALCDTNNMTQNIDFILPVNNRGKKALALLFWILAREVLKAKGELKSDDEFAHKVEDFEAPETKEEVHHTSRFAPRKQEIPVAAAK
ncbi:TPA: 30S ribosomal protein S2 [archaeon]|nr:30S ribosomal protein S2 [Candidatus Naiadarchaeales archaeon SRR2090153.bin461]HIK02903.1 30S ribosomal protein S2 [Candidatus Naiadarchaeales archaeon SRR2090159.bin1288]